MQVMEWKLQQWLPDRVRHEDERKEKENGTTERISPSPGENCDDCDQNQAGARSDDKAIIGEAILGQKGEDCRIRRYSSSETVRTTSGNESRA